jgi:hypothetical protein
MFFARRLSSLAILRREPVNIGIRDVHVCFENEPEGAVQKRLRAAARKLVTKETKRGAISRSLGVGMNGLSAAQLTPNQRLGNSRRVCVYCWSATSSSVLDKVSLSLPTGIADARGGRSSSIDNRGPAFLAINQP